MKRCGTEPDAAKQRLDAVRAGDPQRFVFDEADAATTFANEARALGVKVSSEGGDSPE